MKDEKKTLTDLVLAELEPTAKRISALKILESGKVPASATQTRTGRGGKLTYIDHVWTSSLLRDAFGYLWSFDVGDIRLFEFVPLINKNSGELAYEYPKFASATCTLTINVGGYKTSISETGAFDNTMKLNPVSAEASAVHRSLVKCTMLMFGLGTEFYKGYQSHVASAGDLWANLLEYGTGQGLTKDQIAEAIKAKGITKETLVSRFEEARDAVSAVIDTKSTWTMPTEGPDPLVEAALELGGEIVDKMPDFTEQQDADPAVEELGDRIVDQETGEVLDQPSDSKDVVLESVDEPKDKSINWVKFYEWAGENWDDRFGQFRASDAKAVLLDIFGCKATELAPFGKKAIAAAFLEWMKSTNNESREAIREKYRE